MAITRNTIRTSLFSTIYTYLNTNVSDPKARTKQWIFSSFPDYTAANFIGFPIIVINRNDLDKSYELFDDDYGDITAHIEITVYATKASQVDSLSDSLDVAFNNAVDKTISFKNYNCQSGNVGINKDTRLHYKIHKYDLEMLLWILLKW